MRSYMHVTDVLTADHFVYYASIYYVCAGTQSCPINLKFSFACYASDEEYFLRRKTSFVEKAVLPDQWRHVNGNNNPTDYTSRGLFLSELLVHNLCWNGPDSPELPSTH